MSALGVGFSSDCTAAEIVTLVGQVLSAHAAAAPRMIATLPERATMPALVEAAAELGLTIIVPPIAALQAASAGCLSRSDRVVNRFGLPSVAEACALAAEGKGAMLAGPRTQSARATCALAIARPA